MSDNIDQYKILISLPTIKHFPSLSLCVFSKIFLKDLFVLILCYYKSAAEYVEEMSCLHGHIQNDSLIHILRILMVASYLEDINLILKLEKGLSFQKVLQITNIIRKIHDINRSLAFWRQGCHLRGLRKNY